MFGMGLPELLVILVIVLIIFGAGKLPELGDNLGKGIRNFRKATSEPDAIDVTPPKADSATSATDPARDRSSERSTPGS
jgi:sec-independent protein translocase protein TatA